MKKIILLAAFMLPGILFAQPQQTEVYVSGGGNYNRSCIGGTGRCTGDLITQSKEPSHVLLRKLSENQIELSIHKNDFTEEEFKAVMQDMNFLIGENIQIEAAILRQLDMNPKLTFILPDNYPIVLRDDRFDIVLTLSEK